ncbi:cytochrome b/b6 domain-containing protein [Noviherbaspirillum sp. CPCC 100848]|uniref:Cytochrome b/b6 domain-containing protein n=1 Tax=Noviherbaspirillum album TaxID=3080276 RepID=A0ABU6J9X4_9BURK|nr:cytochrome b/b6 domain-containing protein [Noviherbaspirillum sp. CPCC 100848]MEC4720228.1 cytochrome b/b6 domain-containing protein [Noviherbaspirillum sp. CPCC 100848]
MKKVRVWDLPVRLFHWALAVLIVAAVVTQNIGGNAMEWHFRAGYSILALLAFRIVWGLIGPRYARFSSFIYGPSTIVGYVRGGKEALKRKYLGHNPLGSLSVFALLGAVLAQAVSGLYANDDIASEGPLVKFISKDLSDQITWFHKDVSATLIYILVAMHILAIIFYHVRRRQNLVKPMLTGDHEVDFDAVPANDSWGMRLLAAVILALCAAAVYWLISLPPRGMM